LGLTLDLLTTSAQQAPISAALEQRLQSYLDSLNTTGQQAFGERYEYEYYRRFLSCIRVRLAGVSQSSENLPLALDATLSRLTRIQVRAGVPRGPAKLCTPAWWRTAVPRLAQALIDPLLLEVRTYGLHSADARYPSACAAACRGARRSRGLEV
jgi:phosphoenolpyruvate carboxylase